MSDTLWLLFMVALWVLGGYARVRLANRFGVRHRWLAFVPLLQMEFDRRLAGVSWRMWAWGPFVIIPLFYCWMRIMDKLGRGRDLMLVAPLPILGAFPLAYVVFTQPDFDAAAPAQVQA